MILILFTKRLSVQLFCKEFTLTTKILFLWNKQIYFLLYITKFRLSGSRRPEVFFKKLSGRIAKGGMNKKMHVLVNLGHSED